MIKKCHYDVILWGGFGSTKCDPNLTSHLRRFFAGSPSKIVSYSGLTFWVFFKNMSIQMKLDLFFQIIFS